MQTNISTVVNATLRYVTAPDDNQLEGIKKFLLEEFDAHQVELEMIRDERLVGGLSSLQTAVNGIGASADVSAACRNSSEWFRAIMLKYK